MTALPVRMCPECRTTDASFPLIPGCQTCADVLAAEEQAFWNEPLYYELEVEEDCTNVMIPVSMGTVLDRIFQPLRTMLKFILLD